jgi:hypothetical protein
MARRRGLTSARPRGGIRKAAVRMRIKSLSHNVRVPAIPGRGQGNGRDRT